MPADPRPRKTKPKQVVLPDDVLAAVDALGGDTSPTAVLVRRLAEEHARTAKQLVEAQTAFRNQEHRYRSRRIEMAEVSAQFRHEQDTLRNLRHASAEWRTATTKQDVVLRRLQQICDEATEASPDGNVPVVDVLRILSEIDVQHELAYICRSTRMVGNVTSRCERRGDRFHLGQHVGTDDLGELRSWNEEESDEENRNRHGREFRR